MSLSSPNIFTRLYYSVKPIVPRRVRWLLRRRLARSIRPQSGAIWPIDESAAAPPEGWPGWPDGKKFAVVLTHDVEGQVGLDLVRPLAELEMELGFRSSFNFIPEGEYRVPDDLREWLIANGFEVGIHDLHHDGNLYSSRERFREKAVRINHYLKTWNACGFRSGFMLRRLEWLHDLEIAYDCSTFDTDPFEPQPDGAGTIFPFRIVKPDSGGSASYMELPYTLPQDSTLYLLLEESSPKIWDRKLDWVVEKGGMALVNVHPDYIVFGGESTDEHSYPASHYGEWLKRLASKYEGQYWHVVPKDLAAYADKVLPRD